MAWNICKIDLQRSYLTLQLVSTIVLNALVSFTSEEVDICRENTLLCTILN